MARVKVGPPADGLVATQAGPVGYALDTGAGTLVRVDPGTFVADAPVRVIEGATDTLSAHATGDAVYVIDQARGRVAVTDPDDVATRLGADQSAAGAIGSSLVDRDGRLWLLAANSGDLVWFDGHARHSRRAAVTSPRSAELVLAAGR